jgi:phosphotriesterase-related protein
MPSINTVRGPIDINDLGFTLMHEHLCNTSAGIPKAFPTLVDKDAAVERALAFLGDAEKEGVRTVVDVTTMDLGRDMDLIQRVAERTDVNIIVATGIWIDVPRAVDRGVSVDRLAEAFIRDIEIGLDGTTIKPGIIKVATDEKGVTPINETILRAAARASKHTNVPITTHTSAPDKVGIEQIRVFEEEGVDFKHVYIGHSNDTNDLEYLSYIGNKGCTIGMDRYPGGRLGGLQWRERTQTVKSLIDMGLVDRVTLAHDYPMTTMLEDEREVERQADGYNPDGIAFISRFVLPLLKEWGITEEQIHTMMVDVPKRYFGG